MKSDRPERPDPEVARKKKKRLCRLAQTPNQIINILRVHPGKTGIPLLSLALRLGWLGMIFGFVIGSLVDGLIRQIRLRQRTRRFFSEGVEKPGEYVFPAAILVLIRGIILADTEQNGKIESRLNQVGREVPEWPEWSEAERRQIEPILDVLMSSEEDTELSRYCSVITDTARISPELLIRRLTALTRDLGISPEDNRYLHRTAETMGVPRDAQWKIFRETKTDLTEAYRIMGISETAKTAEIKRIYHSLAAQFHPDGGAVLNENQKKESQEAFLRIQDAYEKIICVRSAHPNS